MMSDTWLQARKSKDAKRLSRLVHMLRNTLRNFPMAKLHHGKDVFGALLGDGCSISIHWTGNLSNEDLRDLLALFATWLVVDGGRLIDREADDQDGASWMESELSFLSHGRLG